MKFDLQACSARHPAAASSAAPALRAMDLAVASGEQLAVIGPSGAGKTTLLQVMACALRPTQGAVHLDGANPWGLSGGGLRALRKRLFLAPQVPPLPPRQRVVSAVLAAGHPAWRAAVQGRDLQRRLVDGRRPCGRRCRQPD